MCYLTLCGRKREVVDTAPSCQKRQLRTLLLNLMEGGHGDRGRGANHFMAPPTHNFFPSLTIFHSFPLTVSFSPTTM